MHTQLNDMFSRKFWSFPPNYIARELSTLMMFGIPKRVWLPERLLLPNHKSRIDLETLGIDSRILEVLPWGIDVRKYDQIKSNCQVDSNAGSIVYAGPLHKLRFSYDIIDAFAAISQDYSDVTLSLLFRGVWDSKMLTIIKRKIMKYKIEDRVEIVTERLAYEELMERFAQAKFIVLPYLLSGIVEMPPLTLIEAMALSKTVITNAGIATNEIIKNGHNGIISQQNTEGYMESFGILLSNMHKTTVLGQRARESILKGFSLPEFCSRLQVIMEAFV